MNTIKINIKKVDHYSLEYRLIRRFYNLIKRNDTVSFRTIQLLYIAFQNAALDRSVRKSNKDADLFTRVNEKVIALFDIVNPVKGDANIEFGNIKLLEEMESYVIEKKMNYAITLLKSFIRMQGYQPELRKAENLLKRINSALEKGHIDKRNRLYDEITTAKNALEGYLAKPKEKIEPELIGLSASANGICDNRVKCTGLLKSGKLKKGYKYVKGGKIEKVSKKKSGLSGSVILIDEDLTNQNLTPDIHSFTEVNLTNPHEQKQLVIQNKEREIIKPLEYKKKENQAKINSTKKTLTSKQLMNMQFDVLQFDQGWENFMQEPPRNMRLGVLGKPKNGKTAGACQLAAYLTKFGKVLYNFADQGYNPNTQKLWKLAGLDTNDNAESSDFKNLKDLDDVCACGEFQFIFIDLINSYIDRTKIKAVEFEDRFLKKYPNISFILIFEVTKQGLFKGEQKWMHLVDTIVDVKDYLMESKGRYGNGYHVVWSAQFKKLNPKKYKELFPEETDNSPSVLHL